MLKKKAELKDGVIDFYACPGHHEIISLLVICYEYVCGTRSYHYNYAKCAKYLIEVIQPGQ